MNNEKSEGIDIQWKNYRIFRLDDKNIVIDRTTELTAEKDQYTPNKELIRKKGDAYSKVIRVGYFGRLKTGLEGLLDDYVTSTPCETLEELKDVLITTKKE